MNELSTPEINDVDSQLHQLSRSPLLRELIEDISNIRIAAGQLVEGATSDYMDGDVEGMHQAMQAVFDLRQGERNDRQSLGINKEVETSIYKFAGEFGLVGDTVPLNSTASTAVVLGGRSKGCLQRTMYTKELLDNGHLKTESIVLLGSDRPVDDRDREIGGSYVGDAKTEYDLMKQAAIEVFGVNFEQDDEFSGYDDQIPDGFPHSWLISHAQDQNGVNIFVLSAPMLSEQRLRRNKKEGWSMKRRDRANTLDTWEMFAKVAQFGQEEHVVAVTNAHFRPFQGADAVNALQEFGATAEVVGYDPSHFGDSQKSPEELLQESLSAVNSLIKASTKLTKK